MQRGGVEEQVFSVDAGGEGHMGTEAWGQAAGAKGPAEELRPYAQTKGAVSVALLFPGYSASR